MPKVIADCFDPREYAIRRAPCIFVRRGYGKPKQSSVCCFPNAIFPVFVRYFNGTNCIASKCLSINGLSFEKGK